LLLILYQEKEDIDDVLGQTFEINEAISQRIAKLKDHLASMDFFRIG
jgi:hypothetical protein